MSQVINKVPTVLNDDIIVITETEFSYSTVNSYDLITINKPTILLSRFKPDSHGHTIQDNVIPVYWLSRVAGLNSWDVVFRDEFGFDTSLNTKISTGPMPYDSWFSILKADKLYYQDELDTLVCPSFVFCKFEGLYTGFKNLNLLSPHLSYMNLVREGKLEVGGGINEDFDVTRESLEERSR